MGPQQESCLSEVNMEIKQYLHNDAAHAFFFFCQVQLKLFLFRNYLQRVFKYVSTFVFWIKMSKTTLYIF